MSITHIDNIGIPKHEKHLRLLSSGTKLFITFELKGLFDIRKRDEHSFYADFSICPPFTCAPTVRPRRANESQPSSSDSKTQLTDFSQISAHASGVWRHSHPWSHPLSKILIVTSLNDMSAPRAREHLRSCLHLTNPCTEPKGSQPK